MNHAKMFVVADIITRRERQKGSNVFFPIAMHYSGNTAQKTAGVFSSLFLKSDDEYSAEEKKIFNLYHNIYGTPELILRSFTEPLNILDFYSQEILEELHGLGVSCDSDYLYTTKDKDFYEFIKVIISLYQEKGLLVKNVNNDLALDYNNESWQKKVLELLGSVEFIQPFQKNNIKSAMANVRNDWPLLRKTGFGVIYDDDWIVDPMFDSEIFTVFDIYARFRKFYPQQTANVSLFFQKLFRVLAKQEKSSDDFINQILNFLPCNVFISEEHLKNWIVKKLYAESALLSKEFQTEKFFVLGMGFLDGKHMSASKGHAILAKDLIRDYGTLRARLIILLGGGHPSKMYEYDKNLPIQADRLLVEFYKHFNHLINIVGNEFVSDKEQQANPRIVTMSSEIEKNIEQGYYRQAIIELLSILPKKYKKNINNQDAKFLLLVYKKYSSILLPGLLDKNNLDG